MKCSIVDTLFGGVPTVVFLSLVSDTFLYSAGMRTPFLMKTIPPESLALTVAVAFLPE
jgi:hypothetical protein